MENNTHIHNNENNTIMTEETHDDILHDTNQGKQYWNNRIPDMKDIGIVVLSLVICVLCVLASTIVGMVTFPDREKELAVATQAIGFSVLGLCLTLLLKKRNWTYQELGFLPLGKKGFHLLWEIPVMFIISGIVVGIFNYFFPLKDSPDVAEEVAGVSPAWIIIMILTSVIIGPLFEEIIFRRLIMGSLDGKMNMVLSTIVASFIFGIFHVIPAAIAWAFTMGICLAIATRFHNSIYAPLIVHSTNNLIVSFALIPMLF